jgi:hypothetical protein
MKALLICPSDRPAVRFLAQSAPLAALSAFGKPLVAWWLEHLAARGATEVFVLASDRVEQIRAAVGDGSRWKLKVQVIDEPFELGPADARIKYCIGSGQGWLAEPIVVAEYFPGLPESPLFKTYAGWFNGLRALMSRLAPASGILANEIKPGVWVSPRARIARSAELRAPCWIGPHTVVGNETIIGPMAVVENRVIIGAHVEVTNSAIAPETFLGEMTHLKDSVADGSILINWRTASCTRVPDAVIMCSLAKRSPRLRSGTIFGRLAALLVLIATLPLAILPMLWSKIRRRPAFRALVAVRPNPANEPAVMETLTYHELADAGFMRLWPQLWNIVKGDFAWVGNRPLSPKDVSGLSTAFERLWLAAPIGLISLAHAENARDALETRVFASLYALQANWRLDLSILTRSLLLSTRRSFAALF